VPQWILVKSRTDAGVAATEYILVSSLSSGTTYNVTRDVTGIHATDPAWPDGTPWLLLGAEGDGRIQLYASSGVPQISVLLQGASATATTDLVRIGGLDGITGAGTGNYGLFVGDASESLLYAGGNLTVTGEVRANAGYIGSGSSVVAIDSSGLDVGASGRIKGGSGVDYSNGTGYFFGFSGAAPVMRIGSTSQYVRWTAANALEVAGGSFTAGTIQTAAAGARIVLDTTSLRGIDSGGTTQFSASTSTGTLTAGAGRTVLDASGIHVTANTSGASFASNSAYFFTPTSLTGGDFGLAGYDTGAFRGLSLRNVFNGGGSGTAVLTLGIGAGGAEALYINLAHNSLGYVDIGGAAVVRPAVSGVTDLGGATFKWNNIYMTDHDTGDRLFPLVTNSGQIMSKNDGYDSALHGALTIAGCTLTYEFGILVGKSGGC
jgi:hypothetical protein